MDVVSYHAKLDQNEKKTLYTLRNCREIIELMVDQKAGRIFNTARDAFLMEFFSPRVALETAIKIQHKIIKPNENSKMSRWNSEWVLTLGTL